MKRGEVAEKYEPLSTISVRVSKADLDYITKGIEAGWWTSQSGSFRVLLRQHKRIHLLPY